MVEWRDANIKYVSGINGYLGKWKVFSIMWDATISRGDDRGRLLLTCFLPGIKKEIGHFHEYDDAKLRAEEAASFWMQNATPNHP